MQISLSTRKFLFYTRLILSCVVLIYLITFIDWNRIKYILPRLRLQCAWQAFVFLLLLNGVISVRWSMLLERFKIKQRVAESWRIYMISGFYSVLLPGIIGGDVIRVALCAKKLGKKITNITVTVLFERACGLLMILLIAAVAALTVPALLYDEQGRQLSFIIYFLAIAGVILFFLFFIVIRLRGVDWVVRLQQRGEKWHDFGLLLHAFRRLSMGVLIFIMLLSGFAHFLDILGAFFLAKAVHIDQSVQVFFLIMPLVYLMTILPISLGGLGVREGVLAYFLVKAGVLASDAVLLGFLIYLNRVAVALLGGFIQYKSLSGYNLKGYLAR